jgi:hypothetical protein
MGVDVDLAQDPPVASIPPGKIAKIKKYLDEVLDAKLGASKDLRFWEELLGVLNWISSVLVSGRFHLAQVVSARRAAAKYKGMIVTKGLQSECQWWWNVVTRWNRVAILLPPKHVVSPFSLADSPATDAAGGAGGGGGGFFAGLWTAVKFSAYEVANLDIMELEAMTYCIFLKMLIDRDPHLVMGRRFLARNDNQPLTILALARYSTSIHHTQHTLHSPYWHSLGIVNKTDPFFQSCGDGGSECSPQYVDPSSSVVTIDGTAHCRDMYKVLLTLPAYVLHAHSTSICAACSLYQHMCCMLTLPAYVLHAHSTSICAACSLYQHMCCVLPPALCHLPSYRPICSLPTVPAEPFRSARVLRELLLPGV